MATRMQQRRGTAAQWTSANPILAAGEIGFETDTGKFKMGNGSSAWSALSYFADSSDFDTSAIESTIDTKVAEAVDNLVAGAPAALNTLSEIANAIDNNSSFATTIVNGLAEKATQSYVTSHVNATTTVHGIADTAALATQTYVTDTISSELSTYSDTTQVNGLITTALSDYSTTAETNGLISDALDPYSDTTATLGLISGALADYSTTATIQANYSTTNDTNLEIASQITTHSLEEENVHGISNTANLVYTDDSRLSDTRTPSTGSVTTGTIADGAVTPVKIEDSAVTTAKLDASSVTTAKLADSNVTAAKLASDSVETAKIVDSAVTTAKIADSNVTASKLATDAVETNSIKDAAVTADKIANGSIGDTKITLAGLSQSSVSGLTSDLAAKAPLASPALTGTPTAPTATAGTNTTQIATTAFVSTAVANLVDSAPGALDTLNELAAALGDDASFSTTVTNSLALKAPLASPTFTGTVTVSASGIAFTDGTQTKEGVASRTPIIQKTDSYTLSALTERDSLIEMGKATAQTVTIPTNATVAYPVGTSIDILQTGAGQVTIAGASGVTVNATPGLKLRTQWSSATLFKRATDTWVVMGDLTA
jgi:hypothetical protein